jgi:hypothetical protein
MFPETICLPLTTTEPNRTEIVFLPSKSVFPEVREMRWVCVPLLLLVFAAPLRADNEGVLTPMAFFESFNMRTIDTVMWNNLRYYCDSYPRVFFSIEEISDERLDLEFEQDIHVTIIFLGGNKVKIDELVTSGSWRTSTVYTLEYNQERAEWMSTEGIINAKLNDCVPYAE